MARTAAEVMADIEKVNALIEREFGGWHTEALPDDLLYYMQALDDELQIAEAAKL